MHLKAPRRASHILLLVALAPVATFCRPAPSPPSTASPESSTIRGTGDSVKQARNDGWAQWGPVAVGYGILSTGATVAASWLKHGLRKDNKGLRQENTELRSAQQTGAESLRQARIEKVALEAGRNQLAVANKQLQTTDVELLKANSLATDLAAEAIQDRNAKSEKLRQEMRSKASRSSSSPQQSPGKARADAAFDEVLKVMKTNVNFAQRMQDYIRDSRPQRISAGWIITYSRLSFWISGCLHAAGLSGELLPITAHDFPEEFHVISPDAVDSAVREAEERARNAPHTPPRPDSAQQFRTASAAVSSSSPSLLRSSPLTPLPVSSRRQMRMKQHGAKGQLHRAAVSSGNGGQSLAGGLRALWREGKLLGAIASTIRATANGAGGTVGRAGSNGMLQRMEGSGGMTMIHRPG